MISIEEIQTKLCGYPEEILQSYALFQEKGNPEDLTRFVIGLIRFLQDSNDAQSVTALSDKTSLRGDLGIDSITIAEVVFLLEEIFEIEIDNQELPKISTIGELRQFILEKLA